MVVGDVDVYSKTTYLDTARIRQWHLQLLGHFAPVGFEYYAGNFRQIDPMRPCLDQPIGVGAPGGPYIMGASPSTVPRLMEHITRIYKEEICKLETEWPNLTDSQRVGRLSMALATYVGQFIKIHPFINGNGRVSRLIWRWGVLRYNVPSQVDVIPRPAPPYSSIMDAAMRGNYSPLVDFIIDHLVQEPPTHPVTSNN